MSAVEPNSLLIVVDDQQIVLPPAQTQTIGRSVECSVVIDDPRVSRVHLQLHFDGTNWVANDPGSFNGTLKDGQPFKEGVLDVEMSLLLGGGGGTTINLTPQRALSNLSAEAPGPTPPNEPREAPARHVSARRPHYFTEMTQAVDPALFRQVQQNAARTGTSIRIGRGADCHVSLSNDLMVSRNHAELVLTSSTSGTIRDLGSSNGTYVDSRRISEAAVDDRSVITVGQSNLILRDGVLVEFRDPGLLAFEVRNLSVSSQNHDPLLTDVSVEIPARSLVGILGPSGAGKSTLSKAIVGAVPVSGGQILFGGVDLLSELSSTRRSIGYVPQDDILHGQLTVTQSLVYAARLRLAEDASDEEIHKLVSRVLGELSLSGHEDKRIDQLSGGQRKRVSTAMELLTRPPLLVLDEPSSGLDPGNEMSLMELLSSLAKQDTDQDGSGRRVLVVTHSVQSLDQCDYLLVLAPGTAEHPGGRLAYFGPPTDLCAFFEVTHPAEVFQRLENEALDWDSRFQDSRYYIEPASLPADIDSPTKETAADPTTPEPALRWIAQLRLLVARYSKILLGDRTNLLLLAAQAPIIGLMLALISEGAFNPPPNQPPSRVLILLLGLTLSITYLGASNSVREIVKERAIFQREQALGLSASAYVLSKAIVLTAITTVQAIILFAVATLTAGTPKSESLLIPGLPGSARTEVLLFVVLTGVAAVALGLLVSAAVNSADKAMTLLPVALLAMYLLSSGPTTIENRRGLNEISKINSVQWGLSATAKSVDTQSIMSCPDVLDDTSAERCRNSWKRSTSGIATDGAMILMITGLGLAGSAWLLRRRRY